MNERSYYQTAKSTPTIQGLREKKTRPGSVNTIKLRVVCEKNCNSGWMSVVDEAVKPILTPLILGQSAHLNEIQQRLVAAWTAMKMMVCEFEQPQNVATPNHEREFVRLHRQAPDTWRIWLMKHSGSVWTNRYGHNAVKLQEISPDGESLVPPNDGLSKNTQASMFGVGQLAIMSVSTAIPKLKLGIPDKFGHIARQIWPYRSDLIWPPLITLSDDDISNVFAGFNRYLATIPWTATDPSAE